MSSESQALGRGINLFEIEAGLRDAIEGSADDSIVRAYLAAKRDKVDALVHARRRIKADIEFAKQEAANAQEAQRLKEADLARLDAMVLAFSAMTEETEFRGNVKRITVQKNSSQSLEITDENLIPGKFVVLTRSVDSRSIKQALASGEEVPGAVLKPAGLHVRVWPPEKKEYSEVELC